MADATSGEQALRASFDDVARAFRVVLDSTDVTLDAGDLEIGGVEIKDGTSDNRAKVTDQPAVDTDMGLVVRLPRRGTLTNRSGAIAAGNTSQQVMAANSGRRYLFVYNPRSSAAGNSLWINFTSDAVKDQPSIELEPGMSFVQEDMYVSTEKVTIIGATTGHKFVAKEG